MGSFSVFRLLIRIRQKNHATITHAKCETHAGFEIRGHHSLRARYLGEASDLELTYVCNVGEIFALLGRVRWSMSTDFFSFSSHQKFSQAGSRQAGQNLSPLSPSAACSALCPLSRVTHSAPRILWELGTKSGIQVNYFKRIRLRNAPCGYFRNAPDSRCTFRTKFCIPLDFFLENGFTTRNYTSMRQCNSLKSYIVGPLFLK